MFAWISKIFATLFPNAAAFSAITKEWKDMKDEWKTRGLEAEARLAQYKRENLARILSLRKEVAALRDHEKECQHQLIRIRREHRDMQEELIFLRKLK